VVFIGEMLSWAGQRIIVTRTEEKLTGSSKSSSCIPLKLDVAEI